MFSAAPTIIRSTDCRGCCTTLRCALTFLLTSIVVIFARCTPRSSNFPSLFSFSYLPFPSFLLRWKTRTACQSRRVFPSLFGTSVRVFSLSLSLFWDPPAKDLASLDVDLCGSHLNPAPFVFVRVADSRVFRRPLNESRFGVMVMQIRRSAVIVSRFALYNVMLVPCLFFFFCFF